jgi:signal transduction histidine kinase/CheY-like chemotaxis protein
MKPEAEPRMNATQKVRALWNPATRSQLDTLVRAEQIRMLYRQLPRSFAGNIIGSTMMCAALIGERPAWIIIAWFSCFMGMQGMRLILYFHDKKTGFVDRDMDRAAFYWTTSTFLSGALLGAISFVFFVSGHELYQTLLAITVFGAVTAAVPMIGSHMPCFYAFLIAALTPLILRNAMEGDAAHIAMSLIMLIMAIAYLSFGRDYNRMLIESLRNRFENEMLAERLAAQNVDLDAARVEAEQANRAKTQFFAAASHDLRQPLHAMGLFASALAEKIRYPEVASIVASINASVHALESLFNELLDISKLDSGAIKPRLSGFAIQDVLARLREEFTVEAAAKKVSLHISTEPHVIHSDPVLLERIVRNLLSNAIRYTQAGTISLELARRGEQLRVSVRDTGIGIPVEHQQHIFDEFYQVGNPGRTSKKGLGLGLSIVQRMSELLGYRIHVESVAGEGSVFSFEVPIGEMQAAAAPVVSREAPSRTDLSGKFVVVIDDEDAIVDGMKALLSGWGAQVFGSTTGDDVLAAVHDAGQLPDLFIVDYRLGNHQNGIEVTQRLRQELDPEIPAILVTGSITPDLGEQARNQRFEFLLKPVLPDHLRACILSTLGQGMSAGTTATG